MLHGYYHDDQGGLHEEHMPLTVGEEVFFLSEYGNNKRFGQKGRKRANDRINHEGKAKRKKEEDRTRRSVH